MTASETVDWQEAKHVATRALERAGVPAHHAQIQANLLVEAELRGRSSHGLLRLPRIVERIQNGVVNAVTEGRSVWRGSSLLSVDGERGLGPVVAYSALEKICERARTTGAAVAAISNNNHLGMLALYAEDVAKKGQILIAISTSEALVHPWGGRTAMLGTNPIAIGVPASPSPFVMDMATSLVSMGQIHDFAHRGLPLQPGWALDANGDATTDASAAKHGAIAPFGAAKGYALGLAFEVIVASLTASALGRDVRGTLDSESVCNKGDVFIVIESASSTVAESISEYLNAIRACPPTDPSTPVVVPGDGAHRRRAKNLQTGISIASNVWADIRQLAGNSTDID